MICSFNSLIYIILIFLIAFARVGLSFFILSVPFHCAFSENISVRSRCERSEGCVDIVKCFLKLVMQSAD